MSTAPLYNNLLYSPTDCYNLPVVGGDSWQDHSMGDGKLMHGSPSIGNKLQLLYSATVAVT